MGGTSGDRTAHLFDACLALGLGAAVIAALLDRPPTIGYADESYFLYEAKRILDGEVLYRDVFEIYTPVSLWMVAAAYKVFGANITVVRWFAAMVWASIAVLLFATCRTLGVRRSVAVSAAALAVALSHPLWPVTSQHWVATACFQALLLSILRQPPGAGPIRWVGPGLLLGLLAAMQQQKAPPFLLAGLAVLAFDACAAPRGQRWRGLVTRTLAFGLGTAAIVGPVLAIVIAQAGFGPVYLALVEMPLFGYASSFRTSWGTDWSLIRELKPDFFPRVVRALPFLPAVLLFPLAAAAWRRDWARARSPFALLAFCLAALGSIAYFPGLGHYAFIAPILLLAPAWALEAALAALAARRPALVGAAAPVAAAAAVAWSGLHLHGVAARAAARMPLRLQTRFGTIAASPDDLHAKCYPILQELVDADPDHLLFTAPGLVSFYLLTGGRNPTPYQYVLARYTTPAQYDEILSTLERRRVATMMISWWPKNGIDPRLADYVTQHYDSAAAEMPAAMLVFRRAPGK